jgi:hypothetical protein
MPCQSYSSWFNHPYNIWWGVQIINFLIMWSTLLPVTLPFKAQISSSAPDSHTPSAYIPPWMWATKFHTHTKQQAKMYFCVS